MIAPESVSIGKSRELKDQEDRDKAILYDKSCFISAGAGTGKSTIISRKIVYLIKEGRIQDISQFAAITYTRKAAEELKNKIRHSLTKELARPDSGASSREAVSQVLDHLEDARIGTIHGFCSYWLQKHALLLGLDSRFRIASPRVLSKLTTKYFFNHIDELRREAPEKYELWRDLQKYSQLNFQGIVEKISELCGKTYLLEEIHHRHSREEIGKKKEDTEEDDFLIQSKEALSAFKDKIFAEHKAKFISLIERYQKTDKFAEGLKQIGSELQKYSDWEEFNIYFKTKISNRGGSAKNISGNVCDLPAEEILKCLKAYQTLFSKSSADKKKVNELSQDAKEFMGSDIFPGKILISFHNLQQEYLRYLWYSLGLQTAQYIAGRKKENHICDYQDLLSYMRQLSYIPACRDKILQELRYLFVDEYQDVDQTQNQIFKNLSDKTLKNHLFLIRVGDGNQSIYGFRGARQEGFAHEKREASRNEDEIDVTLQVNMRSHENVLGFINWLFSHQQSKETVLSERMPNYIKLHSSIEPTNPEKAVDDTPSAPSPQTGVFISRLEAAPEPDTETRVNADFLRLREAEWMACKIKKIREQKPELTIAILSRTLTKAYIYTDALERNGIRCDVIGRNQLSQSHLLLPLVHLLRLVLQPGDRISLSALLRSPWVGLEEAHVEDFFNEGAVKQADILHIDFSDLPAGNLKENAKKQISNFFNKFRLIHTASYYYQWEELFYLILNSFPLFEAARLQPDSENISRCVGQILGLIRETEAEDQSAPNRDSLLKEIILKIESLLGENDEKIEIPEFFQPNQTVSLMSVHRCKGLEFDVVFLADIRQKLDQKDQSRMFFFEEANSESPPRGASFHLKHDISSLSLRNSPRERQAERDKNEYARLLYVALTRAKTQIHIAFLKGEKAPYLLSFHNWIAQVFQEKVSLDLFQEKAGEITLVRQGSPSVSDEPLSVFLEEAEQTMKGTQTSDETGRYPGEMLTPPLKHQKVPDHLTSTKLTYPHSSGAGSTNTLAKLTGHRFISASSLLEEKEDSNFEKTASHPADNYFSRELSAKDMGTLVHKALEWVDFSSCDWGQEEHTALMNSFRIAPSHHRFLFDHIKQMLSAFKESALLKLLRGSITLGREVPFSGFYQNEGNIAVGYIDLLIHVKEALEIKHQLFPRGLYVIDYKTNAKPSNETWESFQADLIKKYEISMDLYKEVIQNHYKKYAVHTALYHTPSGEMLIY